jgi:glycosyltransferase involved in cell wall biosynthesis
VKRSFIIDGQILQTDAWYRGMGKYLLQVLNELNRKLPPDTEIALLFNDRLECDKVRFETMVFLYPNIPHIHCNLPVPSKYSRPRDTRDYKAQLSACINKAFPDSEKFFLLTSLFLFDFFAEFPSDCHKLLIFYDLTPLLFWRDLGGYFPPDLYMKRFRRLYEAEHIFSISETTRQDLLKIFGLDPQVVTNMNGGFTKIAEKTIKPRSFKVPDKYILLPTGELPHKNNDLAVKAFKQYCVKHDSQVKLLITSHFNEESKQRLLAMADNILFTDNVTDEELEWLYENAEVIVFASKYEGLGMPILDAVANEKPIVASKIPVFEEMSKEAFYYFDPENADDLMAAFEQALARIKFQNKARHYPEILQKYTWSNTTRQLKSYLLTNTAPDVAESNEDKPRLAKPHIAVVGLNPGIGGQIGRLSEPLYFSLSQRFKIDYYFDGNGQHFRDMDRPTFLDLMGCKVLDITQLSLNSYKKYDGVIYLLDKATIPSRVAQRAAVLPGMAIIGSFTGLDEQGELFEKVALSNQSYIYSRKETGFAAYQRLTESIFSKVTKQMIEPSPAVAVLKRGGSKRSIIKKLKALHNL